MFLRWWILGYCITLFFFGVYVSQWQRTNPRGRNLRYKMSIATTEQVLKTLLKTKPDQPFMAQTFTPYDLMEVIVCLALPSSGYLGFKLSR